VTRVLSEPSGSYTGSAGRPRAAAVHLARRLQAAGGPGRQDMEQHPEPVAHRGDPDRRHHAVADRVRGRVTLSWRAKSAAAQARQARRACKPPTAHRPEEPSQVRRRHRLRMATRARHDMPVALLMIDADISRPTMTPMATRPAIRCWSASPSAFRIRSGGRRLRRALWRRGVFRPVAGLSAAQAVRSPNHPAEGSAMVRGPTAATVSIGSRA